MTKKYVIRGLTTKTYWSEKNREFTAYMFATKFDNAIGDARVYHALKIALYEQDCELVEIYTK